MFSSNYLNDLQNSAKNKGSVNFSVCELKREYYKAEPDKYVDMVIIPYRAGMNNPLVKKRTIAQGEWVFSLDLLIHSRIGADKKDYICPKSWNEKCPICDLQYKIYKEQGKDAAGSLRASKRSWLNIALCDQQGSRYGEMLVFNPSYVLFTEKLLDAAIAKNRGLGILPFADVEKGSVVSCHTTQGVLGKNKFVDYSSFDFGQRATPLPQEFVRAAICFEDFLRMPDADELMDLASDSAAWQFQPAAATPTPAYNPEPSDFTRAAPQPTYIPQPTFAPVASAPSSIGHPQPAGAPSQPLPPPAEGDVMCPSGLRFGLDCDTQRACNYCEVWDACKSRNKLAG